jgi:transcriptional regulator with PAS, ATPase and Fis domain
MKQTEFDAKLGQMRRERKQEVDVIAQLQADLKEDIAFQNRAINAAHLEVSRLKQQRQALQVQRAAAERRHNERINAFIKEHHDDVSASWAEVSTYTLIRQLRKRGWRGDLRNIIPDTAPEHVARINLALNSEGTSEDDKDDADVPSDEEFLAMEEKEKEEIKRALELHDYKLGRAAEALGVSERTIRRRIAEYGIAMNP